MALGLLQSLWLRPVEIFLFLFPADEINIEESLLAESFVTHSQTLVVPVSSQNNCKARALGMWDHIPSVTPWSQNVIGFSKTQMYTDFPQKLRPVALQYSLMAFI